MGSDYSSHYISPPGNSRRSAQQHDWFIMLRTRRVRPCIVSRVHPPIPGIPYHADDTVRKVTHPPWTFLSAG